jgi:trans-2,3-dihydro-3-hydroxyanthranilate isomerase
MAATHQLEYRIVDVFTKQVLEGNALAVFLNGGGLETSLMQKIAREMNLSESVFVMPSSRPDCAARLRIFTPMRELPFAGHPTVGTAFVLRQEGIVPNDVEHFVLEEECGPVPLRVSAGVEPLIWLTTPPIEQGPTRSRQRCAAALGLDQSDLLDAEPQILNAGNPTLLIAVKDRDAVDRAWLELGALRELRADFPTPICAFVFAPVASGAYSRMFAPEYGIAEDPATGSSTGPLAAYMIRHDLLARGVSHRFVSEQGTLMGRRSLLHVQIDGATGGIEIGGYVAPLARGVMQF